VTVDWLFKRTLMFLARLGDWYGINRLEHWAYDQIIARGYEGFDTFIRLEFDLAPVSGPLPAEDEYEGGGCCQDGGDLCEGDSCTH